MRYQLTITLDVEDMQLLFDGIQELHSNALESAMEAGAKGNEEEANWLRKHGECLNYLKTKMQQGLCEVPYQEISEIGLQETSAGPT